MHATINQQELTFIIPPLGETRGAEGAVRLSPKRKGGDVRRRWQYGASGRRRPGSKTLPQSHLASQRRTAAVVVVAVVMAVALELTEEGGNAV